MRVFLSTAPEQMEAMLSRANQGLLSTAITVDQLWNKQCVSWIEVRRLELELGSGGDYDQPYTWSSSSFSSHVLAWTKLLAKRECGALESKAVPGSFFVLNVHVKKYLCWRLIRKKYRKYYPMKILFFSTAHNSLSQRAFVELVDRGHRVIVVIASSEDVMLLKQ